MPKFKKETKEELKSKKVSSRVFMLKTVRSSIILAGVFLVLSLVFNGTEYFFEGITIKYLQKEIYLEIIDNSIKVGVILLSFIFMTISLGNYKEYTGKPIKFTELVFLFGLALVQTIRSLIVFIFTLVGLIIIIFYLYLIQES